jgi:hypothetical protein
LTRVLLKLGRRLAASVGWPRPAELAGLQQLQDGLVAEATLKLHDRVWSGE